MAVKIRLARGGRKQRPFYRIVVAHGSSPRDGRFIERLGHYNPMLPKDHPERVVIDTERAKEWLAKGAQPTERVHRMLAAREVMKPFQPGPQTKQHLPKGKQKEA